MPALGVHDPLALGRVDNAAIIAQRDKLAESDIQLSSTATVKCSVEELFRLRQIIDTWKVTGSAAMPFETIEGDVYYLDKGFFESIYNSIVALKNSRYSRLFNYAKTLTDQNNATGDVTFRDISDEQWPQWDSNLVFDVDAEFAFAEWDIARAHSDIVISGADNNIVDTAAAGYVTAVGNQPVYRSSYWEFDITGNADDVYIGLINAVKSVSAEYRLGSDAESIGIRINGTVVAEAIEDGVVIPLTAMDASVGVDPLPVPPDYNSWVPNRVALRYDPHNGLLEVSVQEDAVPFGNEWQVVATGLNTRMGGVGKIYPAVSIKAGNAVQLVSIADNLGNYGSGVVPANVLLNVAKGLFVVNESGAPVAPGFDSDGFYWTLPAGTPTDEPIATGDLLQTVLQKLQGQAGAQKLILEILKRNSQGVAIIDMDEDDYVANLQESQNSLIILMNVGDGTKTFTLFDDPSNPNLYLVIALDPVAFSCSFGTINVEMEANSPLMIAYVYSFGVAFNVLDYYKAKRTNMIVIPADQTEFEINWTHLGRVFVTLSPDPVDCIIKDTTGERIFNCSVIQRGAGQVQFVEGAGGIVFESLGSLTATSGPGARVDIQGYDYDWDTLTSPVCLSGDLA